MFLNTAKNIPKKTLQTNIFSGFVDLDVGNIVNVEIFM